MYVWLSDASATARLSTRQLLPFFDAPLPPPKENWRVLETRPFISDSEELTWRRWNTVMVKSQGYHSFQTELVGRHRMRFNTTDSIRASEGIRAQGSGVGWTRRGEATLPNCGCVAGHKVVPITGANTCLALCRHSVPRHVPRDRASGARLLHDPAQSVSQSWVIGMYSRKKNIFHYKGR